MAPPQPTAVTLWARPDPDPRAATATAGFAHRRLTIIDLSEASDQPMLDPSGELAIAYNGELQLPRSGPAELLGREFATSGDTEVVLQAYAEWGPACLDRMVGMWALAILDAPRRELFLAVDRFGVKPLFWTVADGRLYFASEIKALLAAPAVRPESPDCFFEGIHRLLPASVRRSPESARERAALRALLELPVRALHRLATRRRAS